MMVQMTKAMKFRLESEYNMLLRVPKTKLYDCTRRDCAIC